MAALYEGYTLFGLVQSQISSHLGIRGIEQERDDDHVVVTDSTRSVTLYKVSFLTFCFGEALLSHEPGVTVKPVNFRYKLLFCRNTDGCPERTHIKISEMTVIRLFTKVKKKNGQKRCLFTTACSASQFTVANISYV